MTKRMTRRSVADDQQTQVYHPVGQCAIDYVLLLRHANGKSQRGGQRLVNVDGQRSFARQRQKSKTEKQTTLKWNGVRHHANTPPETLSCVFLLITVLTLLHPTLLLPAPLYPKQCQASHVHHTKYTQPYDPNDTHAIWSLVSIPKWIH